MAQQVRPVGGSSSKVLLKNLESVDNETAAKLTLAEVRKYLQPVLKAASSHQGSLKAGCQPLGKLYASFVVNLLRTSMTKVTSEHKPSLRAVYVELALLGLESLSVLRTFLKGRPHEVEIQRYLLLRTLVSLECYDQAVQQSWLLYNALCCHCCHKNVASLKTQYATDKQQPLPSPEMGNAELGNLMVGTVLNLLLSIVEQGSMQSDFSKVLTIVHDFDLTIAWLR